METYLFKESIKKAKCGRKRAKMIIMHVDQEGARISRVEIIRGLHDRILNKSQSYKTFTFFSAKL